MPRPSATISVWLAVTRAWLLLFVFHSARKDGVVKKPTRGVRKSRLPPVRKFVRSRRLLVPWSGAAGTISTIFHCWLSETVSGWLAVGNAGGWQVWLLPLLGTVNE